MGPIPAWNVQGLIPPINEAAPTSLLRSPYLVSLTEVVHRFGISVERLNILDGLLRYRAALHAAGLTQGFQWLDGSFFEHVEIIEDRAPRDIDVVTFYSLPPGVTQDSILAANRALFDHAFVKDAYHVDAYQVSLEMHPKRLVAQSAYWYSMWSHRRSSTWKGYVQVDLDPARDPEAITALQDLQQVREDGL